MNYFLKSAMILLFLLQPILVKSQDTTTTEKLIRYILQPLDKSHVPSGILAEYGAPFLNLPTFNGMLTDSNKVDINKWRTLLFQLNTSYTGGGTSPFPEIVATNNLIAASVHDTLPIAIPILIGNYHSIHPDAITNNLIGYNGSTKQLYDIPARSGNPYLSHSLLAATPYFNERTNGSLRFIVKNDFIWNNSGKTIGQIQIDFNDDQGFQTVTINTAINVDYYTAGTKNWTIKIIFTDSSVLQCYSSIVVQYPAENTGMRYNTGAGGPYGGGFDQTQTFNPSVGVHSGGTVYIAYTKINRTNTLRKPLIVVEGWDVSRITGMENYDYQSLIRDLDKPVNFNQQLDDIGNYDLVFLDFNNGSDDIVRNAKLLEQVISWVNLNKVPNTNNSNVMEQNVVMGLSMGGLVARYALADMTKNSLNTGTKLLITHDSPHHGANMPLGLQYLIRMFGEVNMFNTNIRELYPDYDKMLSLLNQPASQQMLIYRSTSKNTYVGNTFLDGDYRTMVTFEPADPQPTYRFIATSNGSECGMPLASPYQTLISMDAGFKVSLLLSYNFRMTVKAYTLPADGLGSLIAKLHLRSQFKLWFINISKNEYDQSSYAPPYHLEVDGAPGGRSPFTLQKPTGFFASLFYSLTNYSGNPDRFTFVPTASALDVQNFTNESLTASYVNGVNLINPSSADVFIAQNYLAGEHNTSHTLFTNRNSEWLFNEMELLNNPLNCSSSCANSFYISGPENLCGTGFYKIPGLARGSVVSWSVSGGISKVTNSTTGEIEIQKVGNSIGTLTASITTACATTTVSTLINPPIIVMDQQCGYANLSVPGSSGSHNWTVTGDLLINGNTTTFTSTGNTIQVQGTTGDVYVSGGDCSLINIWNGFVINTLYPSAGDFDQDFYSSTEYDFSTSAEDGWSYTWSVTGSGSYIVSGANSSDVRIAVGGRCYVRLSVSDECGASGQVGYDIWPVDMLLLKIYPNPATNVLTVEYGEEIKKPVRVSQIQNKSAQVKKDLPVKISPSSKYEDVIINILDNNGRIVLTKKNPASQNKSTLDISNIPNGNYFVHVIRGKNIIKKQLTINN